jgi:hypothetical protein
MYLMLDTKIKSRLCYQFSKFRSINHIRTGESANQIPLTLFTALLVAHRRKIVDAAVLIRSRGTTLSLLDSAVGFNSLVDNTSGIENTAVGSQSMVSNQTGYDNTAVGYFALNANTGDVNTAIGAYALWGNINGYSNSAVGESALASNTSGIYNTAVGSGALDINVTAQGRLGVLASSERYKTTIAPMSARTERLQLLRPVTFHLKSDPTGVLQYGLIAEEVDKVYPELVIRDSHGKIQGVRYDELAPMLVNEMQRQRAEELERQRAELAEVGKLKQQMRRQQQQLEEMQAVISKLPGSGERLAAR